MNGEAWLFTSVVASLVISLSMWRWLKPALQGLLEQLCDRPSHTDFWLRYTLLMLVLAPLSVSILFSPDPSAELVTSLRRLLLAVLLGHFAGFAIVGRGIFNAVREAAHRNVDSVLVNLPRG